ncbi:hypothetical protein BC940DRAFT_301352 [Gongronella butleri]|nr:hypothetical protein BC940DRAFT_301352 [Gongronella butleri]
MSQRTTNTIPITRPKRSASSVRPTRASLARQNSIQSQQQQRKVSDQMPSAASGGRPSLTRPPSLPRPSRTTSSDATLSTLRTKPSRPLAKPVSKQQGATAKPAATSRPLSKSASMTAAKPGHATTTGGANGSKKRKSMTTIESLKKRPSWDMRGKVSDLEELLATSNEKLHGLYKFRDELQVLKDDKESERKDAIQQAVALKAEMQRMDKEHEQEIENMNAQQRIHYQELEDKHLIYKRRVTTIELELQDCQRKWADADKRASQVMQEHQQLEAKMDQVRKEMESMDHEIQAMDLKLQRFGGTLQERERAIAQQQAILDKEAPATERAEAKLKEVQANRHALEAMIKELQQQG